MKPDITLESSGAPKFILDAKWKRLKPRTLAGKKQNEKRGVVQADMYQLYAYGKRYECRTVALVYPQTNEFREHVPFVFDDDLTLLCLRSMSRSRNRASRTVSGTSRACMARMARNTNWTVDRLDPLYRS